jgi:hypothetical protein
MLTDEELALRLISTEDSYVERKTAGDNKRWIPALVAFANSAPYDFSCVLFIGAKDDGTIEPGLGIESLQKSFSERAGEVFPPIPHASKVFRKADRECLAIIVQGSPDRPHYAGLPYIRVGTESRKANVDDIAALTAQRDPKAHEIMKWQGKRVTLELLNFPETGRRMGRVASTVYPKVRECNRFWVTFDGGDGNAQSVPLRRIDLAFDDAKGQLKLEVQPI